MSFTEAELESMTVAPWERAKQAIADGRLDDALGYIDDAAQRTRGLQIYSIEWITSLLSFVGRELGEDAVERALRASSDDFIRARREPEGAPSWDTLPATVRAKAIARAMVANGGGCEVDEDEEKIVLAFRCGSGGRLIDAGRYDDDGGPYLTLRERGPRTFERDALPVYCAHCSVNNEIQPVEWGGAPTSIEYPPERAGEPCIHHVYKDVSAIPDAAYVRIGVRAATRSERPPSDV
ncbi:MAG: hypothetical protein QOI95_4182 [Acidimicrobiaceae bacterium]|jgi:hypothetical protein